MNSARNVKAIPKLPLVDTAARREALTFGPHSQSSSRVPSPQMNLCQLLAQRYRFSLMVGWMIAALATPAWAGAAFRVVDLGTFGGPVSWGLGLNALGHAVGFSDTTNDQGHAFLYTGGSLHDLGTLGGRHSHAYDVNLSGQVTGWAENTNNHPHAFLWENGVMTDLGTLGGDNSMGRAINHAGVVAGYAMMPDRTERPVIWLAGEIRDLGTLGGPAGGAWGINNQSAVIGSADVRLEPVYERHAFLWDNDVMIDLGTLGGALSEAFDVNESLEVVGASLLATSLHSHAFSWRHGVMTDLGTLGTTNEDSAAEGINDHGLIVGWSDNTNGQMRACLWMNGCIVDLNELIDPASDWELFHAKDINNAGWIVGIGAHYGQTRGFLLIPEPAAPGGPVITQAVMTAEGFVLRGTNGPPLAEYQVLYSTDITQPMTNWAAIATNVFDLDGAFACTNGIPDWPVRGYFRLLTTAMH